MATGSVTIRDYSDELTVTRFTAGGPETAADYGAAITTLFNAGVITGKPIRAQRTETDKLAIAGPVASNAQRELKWVLTYEDNSEFLDPGTDTVPNPGFGRLYNLEIGTADPSILPAGTDVLPSSSTEFSDFFTFLSNINLASPTGGTSILLRKVRLVGRNI